MISDPILVVDDAPDMRSAMTTVLTNSGYPVESAVSGNEALNKFERGRFSMIITDAGTPSSSGMDVLVTVKRVSPETPVIVTTANGSVNHAVEVMQAGASDYILKPFSPETLQAAVNMYRHEARRRHQFFEHLLIVKTLSVELVYHNAFSVVHYNLTCDEAQFV